MRLRSKNRRGKKGKNLKGIVHGEGENKKRTNRSSVFTMGFTSTGQFGKS
jgi:hypothetical protein